MHFRQQQMDEAERVGQVSDCARLADRRLVDCEQQRAPRAAKATRGLEFR